MTDIASTGNREGLSDRLSWILISKPTATKWINVFVFHPFLTPNKELSAVNKKSLAKWIPRIGVIEAHWGP